MDSRVDYKVNSRENVYFYMRLVASLGLYYVLLNMILMYINNPDPKTASIVFVIGFYAFFILLILFFRFGILIGFLKGNAVKLGKNQLPDIYQVVVSQSEQLGLNKVPAVYIMQSGGVLNAFATKFLGRNYIVLYSEIVEAAYEQDKSILEFIIAHELGHIKRNHMLKNLWLFPSYFIPFLSSAYSRACEFTCDNIGHALCPAGARGGLLVLASGKGIYKKVNLNEFLRQDITEDGFWKWFAEKISSHPNLTRRLEAFGEAAVSPTARSRASLLEQPMVAPVVAEVKEDDHSRYLPQ